MITSFNSSSLTTFVILIPERFIAFAAKFKYYFGKSFRTHNPKMDYCYMTLDFPLNIFYS